MRLSHGQIADLGRLAVDRCEHSLQSVTQLMNGPQTYAVVIAVACSFIEGAADMLQQGMEEQNGKRPTDRDAVVHVVGDVLNTLGVKWKRSSSRTRSGRK